MVLRSTTRDNITMLSVKKGQNDMLFFIYSLYTVHKNTLYNETLSKLTKVCCLYTASEC